jgi:hypothetical protein
MSLSITSIYQPLNDFFRSRFATPENSTTVFRFDRFGSAISDADFIDPAQPEAGYSAVLAREKVSVLANRVPVDGGDGVHVTLSSDSFDSFYFDRLLTAAEPFIPAGSDATDSESIITAFSRMKSRGQQLWKDLTLESSSGLRLSFRPVEATPTTWYDRTRDDVWTRTSFTLTGDPRPQAPPAKWMLRPSDAALRQLMTTELAERPVAAVAHTAFATPVTSAIGVSDLATVRWPGLLAINTPATAATVAVARPLSGSMIARLNLGNRVDLRKRLMLRQVIDKAAVSQEVKTDRVEVSFDYCLVTLQRPWYLDSFMYDRTWRVPNQPAGGLTRPGDAGNVSAVPVGFVAIRNLRIQANWSDQDRANAQGAMSFGPFDISASYGSNEVGQPGVQVIGWMIQQLPALPPNPPRDTSSNPDPKPEVRRYTVRRGDTLARIAKRFYGDEKKWKEIAKANHLSDPNHIEVGQKLVIP